MYIQDALSVTMLFLVAALALLKNFALGIECNKIAYIISSHNINKSLVESILSLGVRIRPVHMVQAKGLNATFLCQHPTDSGTIEWIINGTTFRRASNGDMIRIEGRGNSTEALIMRAVPQFNETEVVCVLFIIEPNGNATVDRSTPATLTIQGT